MTASLLASVRAVPEAQYRKSTVSSRALFADDDEEEEEDAVVVLAVLAVVVVFVDVAKDIPDVPPVALKLKGAFASAETTEAAVAAAAATSPDVVGRSQAVLPPLLSGCCWLCCW